MQQRYGCLMVAAGGTFSCGPPLLGWISSNVEPTATAGLVIALNITFTVPGHIIGSWIYSRDEAKIGYSPGHWTNASLLLLVSLTSVLLRLYYARANRQRTGLADARLFVY
jgi:predicted MFS family arabinose efflux permease